MKLDGQLVLSLVPELLTRAAHFEELRPGVEIARLYAAEADGSTAAFLRYAPGAEVPWHRHAGYEHVLVLHGEQHDDRGRYTAGTLVINPPGSEHRVASSEGCLALLIWQKPVVFLSSPPEPRPRA